MGKNKQRTIAILFIILAVVFISIGIMRGEAHTIFEKGINICLECIGIG